MLPIALILVASLNVSLLARNHPPKASVSEVQYQSLLFSVATANYYAEHGIFLVDGLKPGPPMRFEDVAVDDVGYPIALSMASAIGLVQFSEQTRYFVSHEWELQESREFMYDTLRNEIDHLNRIAFSLAASVLAVVLVTMALRLSASSASRSAFFSIAIVLFLVGSLVPHLIPRLFVHRLHVHGAIATLVLVGLAAVASLAWATRSQSSAEGGWSILLRIAACVSAGFLLATVLSIRRAEGFVWVVIFAGVVLSVVIRSIRGMEAGARSLILPVILLMALGVGYTLPAIGVSTIVDAREAATPDLVGEVQPPRHPIYHSTLIGISRSSRNSLGIASEEDVVALVQRETGITGNAFSAEYDDASKKVFLSYVMAHPLEYVSVLIDNSDEVLDDMLFLVGVRVESFGRLFIGGTIVLWIFLALMIMWRRGQPFRFVGAVLLSYLALGLGIALATPFPGVYGPTTGVLLVIAFGFGAGLCNRGMHRADTLGNGLYPSVRDLPRKRPRVEIPKETT